MISNPYLIIHYRQKKMTYGKLLAALMVLVFFGTNLVGCAEMAARSKLQALNKECEAKAAEEYSQLKNRVIQNCYSKQSQERIRAEFGSPYSNLRRSLWSNCYSNYGLSKEEVFLRESGVSASGEISKIGEECPDTNDNENYADAVDRMNIANAKKLLSSVDDGFIARINNIQSRCDSRCEGRYTNQHFDKCIEDCILSLMSNKDRQTFQKIYMESLRMDNESLRDNLKYKMYDMYKIMNGR